MKKPSVEILRGIVGGAFLMRTLEGVSSLIMMAAFASGIEDLFYSVFLSAVATLVAAPISAAYLVWTKRKYVHWMTIAILTVSLLLSLIDFVAPLSSAHEIRHSMKVSVLSRAVIEALFSVLLIYFVIQIKSREKETEAGALEPFGK